MDSADVSPLGTKEHWEATFQSELQSYMEDETEGEVWFGAGCMKRLSDYLSQWGDKASTSVVDLGCGNGHVLRKLRALGFAGDMVGVDYAESAVQMARHINGGDGRMSFHSTDLTDACGPPSTLLGRFSLAVDKGTLDAIGLSPDGERAAERYARCVRRMMADGPAQWVVCSCNYTCGELQSLLEPAGFRLRRALPPGATFSFGGRQGVTNVIAVFDAT